MGNPIPPQASCRSMGKFLNQPHQRSTKTIPGASVAGEGNKINHPHSPERLRESGGWVGLQTSLQRGSSLSLPLRWWRDRGSAKYCSIFSSPSLAVVGGPSVSLRKRFPTHGLRLAGLCCAGTPCPCGTCGTSAESGLCGTCGTPESPQERTLAKRPLRRVKRGPCPLVRNCTRPLTLSACPWDCVPMALVCLSWSHLHGSTM